MYFVHQPSMSGFTTRPVMMNGQVDTPQGAKYFPPETYPTNQPFVPPEKPLERSKPMSSFPDPSLSSTVMETSVESNNVRQEDDSVISPISSQATPNVVAEKPGKEYLLKHQGLSSENLTEVSVKAPKHSVDPVKPVEPVKHVEPAKPVEPVGIPQGGQQRRLEDTKNAELKDVVPLMPQESNEFKELSDDEESLDLSDLSLPDGNEKEGSSYIPSQLEHKHAGKQEEANAFRRDSEISAGASNRVVIPDATKSITEDISEDIPESVAMEGDEDYDDLPVRDEGEATLPSSAQNVSEHPKMLGVSNSVKDRREDDVLGKEKAEIHSQRTEEEKKPSVSVDGFLCLVQAVDVDVEVSFSPETLYHSPHCSSVTREEVIR